MRLMSCSQVAKTSDDFLDMASWLSFDFASKCPRSSAMTMSLLQKSSDYVQINDIFENLRTAHVAMTHTVHGNIITCRTIGAKVWHIGNSADKELSWEPWKQEPNPLQAEARKNNHFDQNDIKMSLKVDASWNIPIINIASLRTSIVGFVSVCDDCTSGGSSSGSVGEEFSVSDKSCSRQWFFCVSKWFYWTRYSRAQPARCSKYLKNLCIIYRWYLLPSKSVHQAQCLQKITKESFLKNNR